MMLANVILAQSNSGAIEHLKHPMIVSSIFRGVNLMIKTLSDNDYIQFDFFDVTNLADLHYKSQQVFSDDIMYGDLLISIMQERNEINVDYLERQKVPRVLKLFRGLCNMTVN